MPISRYSTLTLFSFFFFNTTETEGLEKILSGKTALKDLTAQRTLS